MAFISEYGLFLAKSLTILFVLLAAVGGIVGMSRRRKNAAQEHIEIAHLNEQYDEMEEALSTVLLSPQELKAKHKARKKEDKAVAKKSAKSKRTKSTGQKRIFVLDFDGDIRASAVASLRREVSALLTVAQSGDEVVLRLESGGGTVNGYGLAASQLQRIRDRKIPLTVAVDQVAASGGYMMACVADKIIAAPFAVIGSIGVLAQIPNLHRLLKKHDIDFEQLTAGKYKRTLTLFGENTDKARKKMQADLEDTHVLFKDYVKAQRPALDVDAVATGEHWFGARALELGLVDALQTSDDYLMAARRDAQLIGLNYVAKKKLIERLLSQVKGEARVDDNRPLLM